MGGKSEWSLAEVVEIFEGKGFRCSFRDIFDAIEAGMVDVPGAGKYSPRRARVGRRWIISSARVFMRRSRLRKFKLGERLRRLVKVMPIERAAAQCRAPITYAVHVVAHGSKNGA